MNTAERSPFYRPDACTTLATRLLGNIAHDIRTPATTVLGFMKMLLENRAGPITSDQRDFIETALNSATVLGALAATVDEAAEGIAQLEIETLDLRELWSEACRANLHRAEALAVTIKESIPAGPVAVSGNRAAITSLLEQVVIQVLECCERGGDLDVDLSEEQGSAIVKITVRLAASANEARKGSGAPFSRLRKQLFVHGGTLAYWGGAGNPAVLTISLPGGSA